jgi:hypothetical protein
MGLRDWLKKGTTVGGDAVGGNKVSGDMVGGDKITGNKNVVQNSKDVTIDQHTKGIDLQALAGELAKLRAALMQHEGGDDVEKAIAIGEIAKAENEAKNGDESKTMEYLANTGKWVLDVAKGVGIPLAVEALKRSVF